jgi:hypothetical protein
MEKRTVRIYKAPDGKGRYINKTSQFLHKAEEGAQVDNGMDQYVQYIQSELQNQTDPQEIYQNLVEAGLPEENAQSLIQQIMQGMPQSQEAEPAQEVEAAQYQDGGEQEVLDQYDAMTDQGQEDPQSYNIDDMIENTPGTQKFQFPGLDQYIPSYNPIGWDESNVDAYENATFERGGTKKSFAKNVLAYLKKQQEGGEGDAAEVDPNQPLGRGNLQDTDTDTISKRKSDFLATLKNQADTAKTEELHGKMMQSGDPSLMQIANTLGQGEKAQPIPFAPVAQTGGFTGGADPMDYFQDGGYDQAYAQSGFSIQKKDVDHSKDGVDVNEEIRRAKINYVPRYTTVDGGLRNLIPWNRLVSSQDKYTRSNAYNVGDKSAYTGNMEGYKPIERRVTKTGIFGRPKEWTDIYSNAPQADPYKGNKLLMGDYPPPSEKDVKSKKDSKPEGWVDITGPDRGGMSDKEWDDTGFFAKMAIRKGDRQGARNEKRYNKQLQKDREFEAFKNRIPNSEGYQFDNDEDYETYWNGLPEVTAMNPNPYKLKGDVYKSNKLYKNAGVEYKPIDFGQDPADKWHVGRTKRYQLGGLPKAQTGPTVKSPTNGVNAGSDPTNPTNEKEDLTKFTLDLDKVEAEADQEGFWDQAPPKETPEYNTIGIDNERKRFGNVNLEEALNVGNAAILGGLGFLDRGKQAKQEADFMKTNTVSNAVYASSSDKDQGDYNENGSGIGMFRPNKTGSNTNGRFAFGQSGGYMQDGGSKADFNKRIEEFKKTPEFKKGLDKMMSENKDSTDGFLEVMTEAGYPEDKYLHFYEAMVTRDWENDVPHQQGYRDHGKMNEYQEKINKLYGSQRYNTPYGNYSEGPTQKLENESRSFSETQEAIKRGSMLDSATSGYVPRTPFDDGRVDPRTLEAIQPSKPDENDPFATETFKKYQLGGYAEGGIFDMNEDELREFLANGGEVEYLES